MVAKKYSKKTNEIETSMDAEDASLDVDAKLLEFKARIVGVAPLLMNNVRKVDPFDPFTKELKRLSATRNKSDEVLEELARVEFEAGMYHNEELGPYIPCEWIESMIRDGAKLSKLGKKSSAAVWCTQPRFKLIYNGPKDPKELFYGGFRDTRSVKLGKVRVMRTRPIFYDWALEFQGNVATDLLDKEQVMQALVGAGIQVGLGDYRPKFGRFSVEYFDASVLGS